MRRQWSYLPLGLGIARNSPPKKYFTCTLYTDHIKNSRILDKAWRYFCGWFFRSNFPLCCFPLQNVGGYNFLKRSLWNAYQLTRWVISTTKSWEYVPDWSTPGLRILDGAFWVQHNLAYSIFMASSFIHWNLRVGLKLCWRRWLTYRFCHQAKILDCLRIGYWGSIPSCSPVILLSYFCYTIVILLCPSMGYLGGIPSCSPVIHTLVIVLSYYCYTIVILL